MLVLSASPVFALNSCFVSISTFTKIPRKLKHVLNVRPNDEICPEIFLESNFEIHVDVQLQKCQER